MKAKTLKRIIGFLRVCFLVGIVVAAVAHPVKWLAFPSLPFQVQRSLAAQVDIPFFSELPMGVRGVLAAVSLLPASVLALELVLLYRLFGWFRRGRFFEAGNVRLIQRLGALLLLSAPVDMLARFLTDLGLNLARAPGHKFITFGVTSANFQAATVGLIVLVAGAIMQQGCVMAEENRFTI